MPPIKLKNLNGIATIVKSNYASQLHYMHFVFGIKTGPGKFFIFQELFGVPIERFVYHESNNSITLVAGWSSWTNPNSLVADANGEMIENYRDLLDRSRPYNSKRNKSGGFNSNWMVTRKQNQKEKKKRHKEKVDTFFEFRMDKIDRAVFATWGMELYSPVLSMVAVHGNSWFPYTMDGVYDGIYSQTSVDDEDLVLEMNPLVQQPDSVEFTWNGRTFDINSPSQMEMGSAPVAILNSYTPVSIGGDILSYWEREDETEDKFDEEIAEMLLDNREKDDRIFNVGQKGVDLIL